MTTFRVDVREVDALADRLARVEGRRLGIAAVDAVNEVTTGFQDKSIKGGLENINLSEAYFRGKMKLSLATSRARAEILTYGDLTVLGRFGGTVNYTLPGATRRAGPVKGRRSAGVYANIENKDRIDEPQMFLMTLRGQQTLKGAFQRRSELKGKGKNDRGPGLGDKGRRRDGAYGKVHVYGPSPYSLFKKQIDVQGPQLRRDLETTAVRNLINEIEKVIL